jgi:hypothetical protein
MGVAVVRHSTQQGLPGSAAAAAAIPITCKDRSQASNQPTKERSTKRTAKDGSFSSKISRR